MVKPTISTKSNATNEAPLEGARIDDLGRYPSAIRLLHWLMALFIICLLASGLLMDELPKEVRGDIMPLHKSFGITVLMLWFARIWLRLTKGVPPYPPSMPVAERHMAKATVFAFYTFMIVMPLSGWLMSNSKGRAVEWFGVPMPQLTGESEIVNNLAHMVHEWVGYALLALVLLHVLAVIKHHVKDKLPIIRRMV